MEWVVFFLFYSYPTCVCIVFQGIVIRSGEANDLRCYRPYGTHKCQSRKDFYAITTMKYGQQTVFFFGKYRTRLVCQCIACLGFSGKIMSVFWTLSLQMFSLFNRLRTILFQYFSFDIAQTFEWLLSQHFLYFLMPHRSYSQYSQPKVKPGLT